MTQTSTSRIPLTGATQEEAEKAVEEAGFEEVGPTKTLGGTQYRKPGNPSDLIRIMPGAPNRSQEIKRGPYIEISIHGTQQPSPLREIERSGKRKMLTTLQCDLLGAFEDDYYGLWELDWTFNSRYPTMKGHERVASVRQLFENGLMHLFIRKDMRDESDALDSDTAASLISDYNNWRAPIIEGALSYFFTTSENGVRHLRKSAEGV
jgi:hypothetical protein